MPDVWKTLPPITAGALSTAVAMYPVDLVRALKMASANDGKVPLTTLLSNFKKAHGLKGFVTQGVGPEMLRATYMRVSKFFLFPIAHRGLFTTEPTLGTVTTKAVAAGVCSLPEGLTIAPIETAKIGLQLDTANTYKNNMTAFIKTTMQQRGWTGLFIGYFGIAYRQTSWTAVYFSTIDNFRGVSEMYISNKKVQTLIGGTCAGMFGAVFNTPGDVIRSAIQKKVLSSPPVKNAFSPALMAGGVSDFFAMGGELVKAKGVTSLWSGFAFKAMHLGGSGALLALLIPMFTEAMADKRTL